MGAAKNQKLLFDKGEALQNCTLDSVLMTTKPPSRYKEASFVKEMRAVGIGRPSTYASTIETIKSADRGYCVVEDKYLRPTELGLKEDDFLKKSFPDLISVEYTREMEKSLDDIAEGRLNHLEFLKGFFDHLEESACRVAPNLDEADKKMCPNCGSPLVIRRSRYGKLFYGCSGYPKCRTIVDMKTGKVTN